MNALEGRTLTGVMITKDLICLKFETTDGDVFARCDAECCSHTWVEHIELPARGFPAKVLSVEDLDLPNPEPKEEHEYVQAYGLKVCTDKGDLVIEYRNESNGWYGGSLSWEGDYFYGGVFGQNVPRLEFVSPNDIEGLV